MGALLLPPAVGFVARMAFDGGLRTAAGALAATAFGAGATVCFAIARDRLRTPPRYQWSYVSKDGTVSVASSIDLRTRAQRFEGSRVERELVSIDAQWCALDIDEAALEALARWSGARAPSLDETDRRARACALALLRLAASGAALMVIERAWRWTRLSHQRARPAQPVTLVSFARGHGMLSSKATPLERAMFDSLVSVLPASDALASPTPEVTHYRLAMAREGKLETVVAPALLNELPLAAGDPIVDDPTTIGATIDDLLEDGGARPTNAVQRPALDDALEKLVLLERDRVWFEELVRSLRAALLNFAAGWRDDD